MALTNTTFLSLFKHLKEDEFDDVIRMRWFQKYAWYSIPLCGFYIFLVLKGQQWMKGRPKLSLRLPLTVWSVCLALFSARGAYVMSSHILPRLYSDGLRSTICDGIFYDGIPGYWLCMFALSKAVELFDTVFIVIRKKKLIFLHWYHHALTVFYCAYGYQYRNNAPCQLGAMINYTVHAIMYTYYSVCATGLVRIPKKVSMCITVIQIVQMVVGPCIFLFSFHLRIIGIPCLIDDYILYLTLLMYATYLILFIHFFAKTYIFVHVGTVVPRSKID